MASDPGILGRAGGGQPRRGRRVIQKGSFPTSRLRSLRDPSDRNLTRRCLLHLHSGSNDRVTPIACNETFRESNHPVCSPCERPETFHFPPTPPPPLSLRFLRFFRDARREIRICAVLVVTSRRDRYRLFEYGVERVCGGGRGGEGGIISA